MAASRRGLGIGVLILAGLASSAPSVHAQFLSNLETDRPIAVEDATPIPFRAVSASVDWAYNLRKGGLNDQGPGWSLLYGAVRNLEVGAAQRYVTRPGRNALRGISSGDLELHALYGVLSETARRPAIAARIGVVFPTGLDSRGTDLELGANFTRSFDSLRLHGDVRWTRLGDTVSTERSNRLEGGLAVDFLASRSGRTDTLVLAGVTVRSSLVRQGDDIVAIEVGARQRIGIQTILFGGFGSEVSDGADRSRLRVRLGISHVF
ncbi:MAG TPA: hypothetical protein VF999_07015 [Thermoanaerobaculia bacterium]